MVNTYQNMFTGQAVINEVKKLDLAPEEYLVISSAVLAVREIRPAQDIDIVTSSNVFERFRNQKGWRLKERWGTLFWFKDNFEVISQLHWEGYPTTLQEAKQNQDIICGVPFMGLTDVVQFKRALRRGKDEQDITLIKDYLQDNL